MADRESVESAILEAWALTIKPHYGYWRKSPRASDGGWLEMIGPGDPGYEEAERRFEEGFRRISNRG